VGATFISERGAVTDFTFNADEAFGPTPSTTEAVAAQNIPGNIGPQAEGGLHSFLASASSAITSASVSIQQTLEVVKNTFFGRLVSFPNTGIGNQLRPPPIENRAAFAPAPRGRPIWTMLDEYPESNGFAPEYDREELARVDAELQLRSPDALEQAARKRLAELGIDTTPRGASFALLGRAAFAGAQLYGSFAIKSADPIGAIF